MLRKRRTASIARRGVAVSIVGALALLASSCGTRADREAFRRALERSSAVQASQDGPLDGSDAVDAAQSQTRVSANTATPAARTLDDRPAANLSSGPANEPVGKLSTTIVGKEIRAGLHVPITGAAPIPTDFLDYMRVIEEYVAKEAPINGRTFTFIESDDGYDPAKGQAACRKLAESDVLLVVGHTMPAIQDGCASLFGKRGIPYLMRGTDPALLKGRPLAYFGTISDDRNGRLLADYALNRLGARSKRSAVVYQNDQTAARDAFVSRIKSGGGRIVATEQSVPRQSDYAATVQKLQQSGAEQVFLSMPPVDAIKLAVQAKGQGYHPQFLGGATYWNYNLTLEAAGMALDGAISFSPWASIDSSAANDFKAIYRRYRPDKEPEDIGLIVWGWFNVVRAALLKAGPQLSRASLADALQHLDFSAPYWNPIHYSSTDHNGARSVAVFRADGQAKRWRQIQGFASEFAQ